MATVECNAVRTLTGTIQEQGGSYTPYTSQIDVGWYYSDSPDSEYRGFGDYDTSDSTTGIPATSTITNVEFYFNPVGAPTSEPGYPNSWIWDFYFGTFIGASLESSDWTGGTYTIQWSFGSVPETCGSRSNAWIPS